MKVDKNKLGRIYNRIKNKKAEYLIGYIPDNRITSFILAVKPYLDELQDLAEFIERELKFDYRRKSAIFRILIFIIMGIFRTNMCQTPIILNCEKNKELIDFLASFSNETTISEQEISRTWDDFQPFRDKIIELVWKIKDEYHKEYSKIADSSFMNYIKDFKRKMEYNNIDKLECINFTKYYPEQIIPINLKYPDDLLLKSVNYGRMSWYNGTYSLVRAVSEIWELSGGIYDTIIARGLGFYIYVPGKDKFYSYMRELDEQFVEDIMLDFTEKLIKEGVVDIYQIMIDSTSVAKRKDELDDKSRKHERGAPDQCYKFQLIADASQTPLIIVRREGEEYDSNGLKNIMNRILKLKKIADKYNKKIEYFLADAGYFDLENLKFIKEKLGAKFIVDINPRRSTNLKKIKKQLNECKKLISLIYKKKGVKPSDKSRAEITLRKKISTLESFLKRVKDKGTGIEQLIAKEILKIGIENYLIIYRRRSVIEGLFGSLKEYYKIAGNSNSKLMIKKGENIGVFALLICIGLQIHSLTKYRLIKNNIAPIKSIYAVRLSELILYYEKENG